MKIINFISLSYVCLPEQYILYGFFFVFVEKYILNVVFWTDFLG